MRILQRSLLQETLGAIALIALTIPGTARAQGVPDNRFSFCDPILVGNTSGTPIGGTPPSAPGFDVSVKDVNNAPVPGSVVKLDFSATTIRLSAVQTPGTTLDCAARTLSRVTNAAGTVIFVARLGGWVNTNAVSVIIKDGELLADVKARSTDIDGLDGRTALRDLVLFSANFLTNPAAQETDFDLNGNTGLGDYLRFTAEFLRFDPVQSYCP